MDEAPFYKKLIFWVLMAMLSAFFAEVLSGSFIFPYVLPWGICSVLPLYGLHLLILAYFVFRGRPKLHTLLLAGFIFGLYEAYVTFVLFDPPWGDTLISIGGVSLIDYLVIFVSLYYNIFFLIKNNIH